jgi:hypothetical protein
LFSSLSKSGYDMICYTLLAFSDSIFMGNLVLVGDKEGTLFEVLVGEL